MLNGQAEPSSQLGGLERAGVAREGQGQGEEHGSCADKEGSKMDWRGVLDVHTCHICGFTAGDVRGLSVHLSSAHPSTVYPRPATHARSDGPVQRQEEEAKRQLSSFLESKNLKNNGGLNAAMEDPDESSQSRNSLEGTPPGDVTKGEKGEETPPLGSATSPSQRKTTTPTPPSPPSKSPDDDGGDGEGDKLQLLGSCPGTPVTATSTLNRPHVVCLPQVRERLRLAWQRAESALELDDRGTLLEAFNAFPYPTAQETGALARRCALPPDDVKVWFMMQRVRYGISWAEEDIRDTRRKLSMLHGGGGGKEGELDPSPMDETMVDMDDDDDDEEEEMMRAFGATDGMLAEGDEEEEDGVEEEEEEEEEEELFPAGLWSAPALSSQLENSNSSLQDDNGAAMDDSFPEFPSIHSLPPGEEVSGGRGGLSHLSNVTTTANPPLGLGLASGSPYDPATGRVRTKKSRNQLMMLRRSFVFCNWPSEGELQRLQTATALSRHEIRKWFADSRYQLRRSGEAKQQRTSYLRGPPKYLGAQAPPLLPPPPPLEPSASPVGQYEVEVKLENFDTDRPVSRTKDEHRTKGSVARDGAGGSLNGYSIAARSIAPSPSSSSATSASVDSYPGLSSTKTVTKASSASDGPTPAQKLAGNRKKTREQTEVLRQHFLHCQWPTAEDYSVLEQSTGLPRTQIIHWFGDTRYSFKHSRLRWITPEQRRDIAKRLSADAHQRAWLVRRQKQWPNLPWDRSRPPPQPSPGNLMDASNSSNSSSGQTLDGGGGGGDFDKWYEMWDGSVQGQ